MGNLCLGKCGVVHCSLWAVQTINFPLYAILNVQTQLQSTVQRWHADNLAGRECAFPIMMLLAQVSLYDQISTALVSLLCVVCVMCVYVCVCVQVTI